MDVQCPMRSFDDVNLDFDPGTGISSTGVALAIVSEWSMTITSLQHLQRATSSQADLEKSFTRDIRCSAVQNAGIPEPRIGFVWIPKHGT